MHSRRLMEPQLREMGIRNLGGAKFSAANIAGWSRLGFGALFVASSLVWPESRGLLASIVALAGLTDLLDGLLARRFDTVSRSGGILDYTADKFFFTLCFLALVARGDVTVTVAAIVLGRDIIVTGLRLAALSADNDFPARPIGKVRTIVMFPALFMATLQAVGATALLAVVVLLSLISLVDYGLAFVKEVPPRGP